MAAIRPLFRPAALAAACCAAACAGATPVYKVVAVARSDSPRVQWTQATHINDAGVLAGVADMLDERGFATLVPVRWAPGARPRLDIGHAGRAPAGLDRAGNLVYERQRVRVDGYALADPQAVVAGANLAGLLVGYRRTGAGWQAFSWRDGVQSDVGAPFAQPAGPALVNDAGTLAWSTRDGDGHGAAFVATGGEIVDVNRALAPGSTAWCVVELDDLNAAGALVAQAIDADGVQRSVVLVPQ